MWLRTSHRPPGLSASSSTATPFRPASPTPRCKTVPATLSPRRKAPSRWPALMPRSSVRATSTSSTGRRGYVPSRQFQLDVALPEASQRVYGGFVAAPVYLCHNGRPAPGGQVGLCTPPTERRLSREVNIGRAGELGRQTTVRLGSGSGGNNRQFSHRRGAGHARAPRGGAR